MPLMVGPDGDRLAAVEDGVTEEQLIAELKELDATQLAIAEAGAMGGRLADVDVVVAAAAMAEVQERALARLNAAAEIETRVREGLAAIAASASDVYEQLDVAGQAAAAEAAAKVGLVREPPPSISQIGLVHEAMESWQNGADATYRPAAATPSDGGGEAAYAPSPATYTRLTPEQVSSAPSPAEGEVVGEEEGAYYGAADEGGAGGGGGGDGGFFVARQQRSKHISEQLLRLQEESRRLQEQSRTLQERAVEMQRQAGIEADSPLEEAPMSSASALPNPGLGGEEGEEEEAEARMLAEEQRQLEVQIQEALASGAEAVSASHGMLGGATPKPAPISWSMPQRGGQQQQLQPQLQGAMLGGKGKQSANFKPPASTKKGALPGPHHGERTRSVSILSPVSAATLAAAAAGDAGRSGYPPAGQMRRLDSAASSTVDNTPVLPSWSGEAAGHIQQHALLPHTFSGSDFRS